jgi:hypothetical protein
VALIGLLALWPAAQASAAECPNEAIRAEQGTEVLALPECMALEQVSPPQKSSQAAKGPAISPDGERIRFQSVAPLGETPGVHVAAGGDHYVASRGASGWATTSTAPQQLDLTQGWYGAPYTVSFSPDFSSWFVEASTAQQKSQEITQVFRGTLGGLTLPISPLLTPIGGPLGITVSGTMAGASADHSRLYFEPPADGLSQTGKTTSYLFGDPKPSPASSSDPNTYIARLDSLEQPSLELLARDQNGKVWGGACGSRLGGISNSNVFAVNGQRNQGAVSADGSRVFFSTRPDQKKPEEEASCNPSTHKLRILERLEGPQGAWIGPLFSSECTRVSPVCKTTEAEGDDFYQGASTEGSKVYFTTNRQLANSDLDGSATECSTATAVSGCDLYLYDSSAAPGHRLIQVSAGEATAGHPTVGSGAKVLNGVTAISGDGSHVYFVAEGALTGANAEGKSPSSAAGARNLYVYERDAAHLGGQLTFIGGLDAADAERLWGGKEGTYRNQAYPVPALGRDAEGHEIGGDGHVLAFESKAALTAGDTDGSHTDVFRYDAETQQLECVSCRPGGPDSEPIDVAPVGVGELATAAAGTDFAEEGRWVSENGDVIAFTTSEGLLAGEASGVLNYYVWRGGELFRLPGKAYVPGVEVSGPFGREKLVVSNDGSEIAFVSSVKLLPSDGDSVADVYVARPDGGYPTPLALSVCHGEECQGPFQSQPGDQAGASETARGANIQAPSRCKKGLRRRKGKCVKPKIRHHKKSHQKKRHNQATTNNRRNAK